MRIAKELGLDVDKLQKDAEDPDIKKALDEAKDLAQKLNLQGTPLYLIGDRVIPGAPDDLYDQLKDEGRRSPGEGLRKHLLTAAPIGGNRAVSRLFARPRKS